MKEISKSVVLSILLTGMISCADFRVRSLNKTTEEYNCHGEPDNNRTVYSPVEESLIRQGALKSRKINLESGIGMFEKTVRLYVHDKNEVRMVFHFMHPIDLEIKKFGFVIQGDSGTLLSGEMHVDYRVTVGGMAEEHAYLTYPADKLTHLLEDERVSIVFDDLLFYIPYKCRETFREIRQKDKVR